MRAQETLVCLCRKYALGDIQGEPQPVEGGLLHRMYHVTTDLGDYAIKLLNPDIMRRPRAVRNMIDSERIARRLATGPETVPVVAALQWEGQQLLSLDISHSSSSPNGRQYAFVYPWLEAHSLFAPDIGAVHCRRIGYILGQIHHAELSPQEMKLQPEETGHPLYDWHDYLALARERQVLWLPNYETMLPNLARWNKAAAKALLAAGSCQVVSHRDLDPKNVLWQGEEPYLIDWEAAGTVNPYQELLEVLNYWGTDENGILNAALCQALLQEYTRFMDLRDVDWTPIFSCGYDGMLGWLEYTLKKSLGIEGDDTAQGEKQLLSAYRELLRYERQIGRLREELEKAAG